MRKCSNYLPTVENSATHQNNAVVVQRKLTVGASNDPLEHEADAVADKVMRMPENPFIQRKSSCACNEYDDERVHLKRISGNQAPFLQAKGGDGGTVSNSVSNKIQSTRGLGNPMPRQTQSFMESRFGREFSDVRIHTGDGAAQLNRALSAKAFTVGSDIYFNDGQYSPDTSSGKHLLAHELTHTIQQGSSTRSRIQKQGDDDQHLLPPVPHYQLLTPGLLAGSSPYTSYLHSRNMGIGGSRRLHLRNTQVSSLRPMFQLLPPVNLQLTRAQLLQIIGGYRPNYFAPAPSVPDPDNDGLRLGGDIFRDMFTGNNQISAVARGLDVGRLRLFNTVFDVLHEPTVTFTSAAPGSGTNNSVQLGISVLNGHFYHDRVEFAPVQLGVDDSSAVTLGSQVEIHTADPHYSYFINFSYTVQPDQRGTYRFSTTGISLSFFPHFLNP